MPPFRIRSNHTNQPTGKHLDGADWVPDDLMDEHAPKLPEAYYEKHGPKPGCTIGFQNEQVDLASL